MDITVHIQNSFVDETRFGTLYVVPTPIGNLEDMTYRAIRILREVDVIAAENTQHTRKLLQHYDIHTPVISHHEHNKATSIPQLLSLLDAGKSIAMVSDAGMPTMSDPGGELIKEVLAQRIAVVPLPGANAALTALVVSGLCTKLVTVYGFLPRTNKKADALLMHHQRDEATAVFYEAPHRLTHTLQRLEKHWGGQRQLVIARELTKKYEQFVRSTLSHGVAYAEKHPPRGEYCIVVEGYIPTGNEEPYVNDKRKKVGLDIQGRTILEHVKYYEEERGCSRKEAMRFVAIERQISRRDVYQALLQDGCSKG
jgi:16S rRNA (cytidine1402-2'-O)-methyltransferase